MAMLDTLQAITHTVAKTRNPNVWMDQDVVFRKLGKPTVEAGLQIQVPVKVYAHDVEAYQGLTPANLDTKDFQRAFLYDWKLLRVPVVYDGQSVLKNSGNKQSLVKLVTSALENAEDALANKMVTMFFGTQTDAGNEFNSINHLSNNGPADHSAGVSPGTDRLGTGVTLGGLSKATYPRLSGYTYNIGGTGIGPVYEHLANALGLVLDGARQPDLWVAHPISVLTFSKTQQGNQRWVNSDNLTAGFEAYSLFGRPYYAQRQVQYHASTFANNRIHGIDTKAIQCYIHADRNFIMEPFVKLQGQDGWVSYRLVAGNFTSDDPQRLVTLHNFDPADTTAS